MFYKKKFLAFLGTFLKQARETMVFYAQRKGAYCLRSEKAHTACAAFGKQSRASPLYASASRLIVTRRVTMVTQKGQSCALHKHAYASFPCKHEALACLLFTKTYKNIVVVRDGQRSKRF